MKPRLLLIACSLVVFPTLVITASSAAFSHVAPAPEPGVGSLQPSADCGGEPCDAVVRGLFAFFDRRPHGLTANGRSCADCHMATDHFQLSPASVEARFRFLQLRRRWNPNADDPLFRPIDADDFRTNGESASDFSNLRQNGLVRIVFPLPAKIRLIDPATNAVSSETFVDVWRAVPTVNDVALTGPDGTNPWPRGPNTTGGYQMDARVATLQEQALGALTNHAQLQGVPPQQLLDDLASFQRVLFTNQRVRALADALREGDHAVAGSRSAAQRARSAGQGRVRARVRAVSRRSRAVDRRRPRSFDSTRSPRSVRVPSIPRCPPASRLRRARIASRATPGPTRSRCPCRRRARRQATVSRRVLCRLRQVLRPRRFRSGQGPPHELGSGPRAVDRLRRRSARPRRLGKARRARAPRDQQHRAVLPQQQRGHARRGGRSLHRVLQAREGQCRHPGSCRRSRPTDGVHFDRPPYPRSARRCSPICESCSPIGRAAIGSDVVERALITALP